MGSRGRRLSPSGIDGYWTASMCRLDRWSRRLKLAGGGLGGAAARAAEHQPDCFSTELVWAARERSGSIVSWANRVRNSSKRC